MPVASRLAVLLPLAAALGACDAEPGLPETVARPVIADVEITPTRDSLATDAPTATIPLRVEADLEGEGAIEVRVLVRYAETDSLAAEARAEAAPGRVAVDVPLTLPRGATGDYEVTVTTEGADGRPGDQAASVFRFDAASLGPPVVTGVDVPASTVRPTSGSTTIPIVATVTDPDGRANIAVVALAIPEVGVLGRLFDAGDGTDETPGDGRYSAGLQIFPDTEAGTFELDVVALDRAGEQSDPFRFQVTVR
ncbi:MAG: hypothetical protein AAF845_18815 [Bacteroidota bacterium]